MCLELKWYSIKHRAKKDIVCYKYVYREGQYPYRYRTPFMGKSISIGSVYYSRLKRYYNEVDFGLHSIKYLKDTIKLTECTFQTNVVKCIIPKGSKYYKGLYGSVESYASDCIKYVEIVN